MTRSSQTQTDSKFTETPNAHLNQLSAVVLCNVNERLSGSRVVPFNLLCQIKSGDIGNMGLLVNNRDLLRYTSHGTTHFVAADVPR